jgi:uncharacterized LabA/DUF88 family protein
VARAAVFIDYQNTYSVARAAFHSWDAPYTDGQIDPLKLAELIVHKDVHDHELTQVRVYRGRPDSLKEPGAYAANLRQCTHWERASEQVHVITRALRYPTAWPKERAEEKGIDVALAIDFVMMAIRGEYEVGVVVSTDTDLKPALEAVMSLGGDPYPRAAVAAWSSSVGHSRRLSISGHRLWCHWLSHDDYLKVRDTTDYTRPI